MCESGGRGAPACGLRALLKRERPFRSGFRRPFLAATSSDFALCDLYYFKALGCMSSLMACLLRSEEAD